MNLWATLSKLKIISLLLVLLFGFHGAVFVVDEMGWAKGTPIAMDNDGDSAPCGDLNCPCHFFTATWPEVIKVTRVLPENGPEFRQADEIFKDGIVLSIDLPPRIV